MEEQHKSGIDLLRQAKIQNGIGAEPNNEQVRLRG